LISARRGVSGAADGDSMPVLNQALGKQVAQL
jgi:hypothetical protein